MLAEAKTYGSEEDIYIGNAVISSSRPIETVSGCCIYKVQFYTYICYTITNESYAQGTDEEKYIGKLFRIYTNSIFLTFLEQSTFATSDYPGSFKHYKFCCLNHIIDIASCEEPTIICKVKP